MRRPRYGYPARKSRTKKIRSPIRVRERIAKKGGRCSGCRQRFEIGAEVTTVMIRRRIYHRATCVPADAGQMPTQGGPQITTAAQVAAALSTSWTAGEAEMVGMLGLENALVVRVKKGMTVTPEIDKAFSKYNACKNTALHVPTGGQQGASVQEKKQAMRLALLELVKLIC